MGNELEFLLQSNQAPVRYRAMRDILSERPEAPEMQALQQQIRFSPIVQGLLSERNAEGELPHHPYAKWVGAHWVLACLADLAYPPADRDLFPLLESVYNWLLSNHHLRSIKTINERVRRCASQEGNALYYSLVLGISDDRSQQIAERLLSWQWPDGGWNCDKRPEAKNSSFMESLIPMRALALYAQESGDPTVAQAAERAAEIFLKRELFKRQQDGSIISEDFLLLHYPCYWHYDVLFALKVMAEAGFIDDPRCKAGLDWLEAKRLPRGGFPLEKKYYRTAPKAKTGRSLVAWDTTRRRRSGKEPNEFVTADALYVLRSAGRLAVQ